MKINMENIGVMRYADFDLGDLTVICGNNNTGKTYATYALYGFLKSYRRIFMRVIEDFFPITQELIHKLRYEGIISIDISECAKDYANILNKISTKYAETLYEVFATEEKRFSESKFNASLNEDELHLNDTFKQKFRDLFVLEKEKDSSVITVTRLEEGEELDFPDSFLRNFIGDCIGKVLFEVAFPNAFICSVERTGASIFKQELLITRNRLLEKIANSKKDVDVLDLFEKSYSRYPMPVSHNVNFIQELDVISKQKESFIVKEYPEILERLSDIVGGSYITDKDGNVNFMPKKAHGNKLTMVESSSIIRSLVILDYYLRYEVKKGDLLIIDEPELTLHPENQRKIARLCAMLVNAGIRVMITTHSDYIVKEFNTLLLLSQNKSNIPIIMDEYGYKESEVLHEKQVKAYIAGLNSVLLPSYQRKTQCNTLTPVEITPEIGMNMLSFDAVINLMNEIQDQIILGE